MKNPKMKKRGILPTAILALFPAVGSADLVTLNVGDGFGTSSFDAAGHWSNVLVPSAGNTYEVSVRYLRTPTTGAFHTFAGDSLTLKTGGSILYKGGVSQTITSTLILDGGEVRSGQSPATTLTLAGTINVTAAGGGLSPDQSPFIINSVVSGTGQLWLTDTVAPFGDFNVSGPGHLITFNAANTFTGDLRVDTNTVGASLSDTSTWAFNIGSSGVNNTILGAGKINLNGLFSFDLTGAGTTLGDTWSLVNHGTLTATYGSTFAVSGFIDDGDGQWSHDIGGGLEYRFSENTGTLTVVGPPKNLVWLGGGAAPNAWDINTTFNWQDGVPASVKYFDGDNVSFTNAGISESFVDITVAVAPGSVTVNSTGNYSFYGSGKITGSTSLNKTDSGQLNLGTANDYTGATNISGGTVVLDVNNAIPGGIGKGDTILTSGTLDLNGYNLSLNNLSGAGTIDNMSTIDSLLTLNQTVDTTFSGLIQNTGSPIAILRDGTSTLTLSSTNTYSGGTSIGVNVEGLRYGVIRATANQALGSGTILIGLGGNDATARLELEGGISLSNNLELPVRNSGMPSLQNISGINTLSGNVVIPVGGTGLTIQSDAGTLNLTGTTFNVLTSAFSRTIIFTGAGDGSVSWPISNGAALAVAVTKDGAGTWTLSGSNTYTGNTTVTDGTLVITNDDVLADASTVTLPATGSLNLTHSGTDTVTALVIGGVPQPNGTYTFGTGKLKVGLATPFEDWAILKGLDGTAGKENGPADDPDKDGTSNLAEFAFNGNPLSGSDNGIVRHLIADSSDVGTDNELILTIAVRSGTPAFIGTPSPAATHDGVIYAIQGSTNLSGFTAGVSVVDPITTGLPDLTGSGYEYRSFSLNGSNGLAGKGFLRAVSTAP
jgi:autotransporter-associated beta strand protein